MEEFLLCRRDLLCRAFVYSVFRRHGATQNDWIASEVANSIKDYEELDRTFWTIVIENPGPLSCVRVGRRDSGSATPQLL